MGSNPSQTNPQYKKKAVYIWFLIILRAQIFSTVLRDGLSGHMGFQIFSLRLRNLWHRYENVFFFFVFIVDRIMSGKINDLTFKPKSCVNLEFHAAGV